MRNKIISDISREYTDGMTLSDFCERVDYNRSVVIYRFESWTNAKVEAGVEEANMCPKCDNYFSRLSNHWSSCGEPKLSEKQKNIITGAVMSDATVSSNGSVTMYSSNKPFLQWINKELEFMSYGVSVNDLGEDRHKRNIKSGFDTNRNADYKDVYRLSCPIHSFTKQMRKLYKENGKELHSIELNPEIVKIWYCGDGGLNWSDDKYAYPEIRAVSQSKYDSELKNMFSHFSFDVKVSNGNIRIYSDADDFLSSVGPAPKGMEYKWSNGDRDIYRRLKG